LNETSQPIELLLSVSRDGDRTLGAQIEDQLRRAIRDGTLKPRARVPSTRDLARQLGVSRRIAVDAYAQLAAEGYLVLRQGARPHVSDAAPAAAAIASAPAPEPPPRFDFRPSIPDVSTFPRAAWLRSLREALRTMTDDELRYGDPRGVEALRSALADYLGRVRGVVATPARVVVTCGYSQGLDVVCRALAAGGAERIAVEDPCNPEQRWIAARAGLEPVPVAVDEHGLRVDELERVGADAVVVAPAHQHPTGEVLTGERRSALLSWLRTHDAIAIEDDYDAEYRYDRAAVGALHGLEPDRIVYAGSASKTLAPALRLGWLVVPPRLLAAVTHEKDLADKGTARIEQHAFADFLARGELDRHLRRMRARSRLRRDALVEALAEALPEATVHGIAAGLHATVRLPDGDPEAIKAEAASTR
jgi:GntR family transcriptional regulator / MocR family aminotransferase